MVDINNYFGILCCFGMLIVLSEARRGGVNQAVAELTACQEELSTTNSQNENITEELGVCQENLDSCQEKLDAQSDTIPCPSSPNYFTSPSIMNWTISKDYCEANSGYLVEITTEEENNVVKNCSRELWYHPDGYFWTGLNDIDNDGTHVWSYSGEEPIYDKSAYDFPGSCKVIFPVHHSVWLEANCTYYGAPLCEKIMAA